MLWSVCFQCVPLSDASAFTGVLSICVLSAQEFSHMWATVKINCLGLVQNISYPVWGGPIALQCFVHINTKRGTNAAELISRMQISKLRCWEPVRLFIWAVANGCERLRTVANGCERLRTVANGCERLRTVANGCEHKSSVARTRLHPQNPKVKREPFATHSGKYDILSGYWWYTYPSEKYESQLGLLFPIYGKILKKYVPNHQPAII